jgi:hypothetical protein
MSSQVAMEAVKCNLDCGNARWVEEWLERPFIWKK